MEIFISIIRCIAAILSLFVFIWYYIDKLDHFLDNHGLDFHDVFDWIKKQFRRLRR